MRKKSTHKKIVKESENRFWVDDGTDIWIVQKTEYKEIPVFIFNVKNLWDGAK